MEPQTQLLADQISSAARLPSDVATFLAEYLISGDYRGGVLHVGVGEYGFSTWVYAVIFEVNGRWYIVSGVRLADGRWRLLDAANGQTAQTLRSTFHFERRCDHFTEITPDYTPEAAPVVDLAPDDSEPGHIYILQFDRALGSEKHRAEFYGGWSRYLPQRLQHHAAGRGAAITRYAVRHGIGFKLVFSAPGTPADEKAMKAVKSYRQFLVSRGVAI